MVELIPMRSGPTPKVEERLKHVLTFVEFIQQTNPNKIFVIEFIESNGSDHKIITAVRISEPSIIIDLNDHFALKLCDVHQNNPEYCDVSIGAIVALRFNGKRYNWFQSDMEFREE